MQEFSVITVRVARALFGEPVVLPTGTVQFWSYSNVRFLPVDGSTDATEATEVNDVFLESVFEKAKDTPLEGGQEASVSVSITVITCQRLCQ